MSNTKLSNKIYIDKKILLQTQIETLNNIASKVSFIDERWLDLGCGIFFDKKINGCWKIDGISCKPSDFDTVEKLENYVSKQIANGNQLLLSWNLPTEEELKLLTNLNDKTPFECKNGKPLLMENFLFKEKANGKSILGNVDYSMLLTAINNDIPSMNNIVTSVSPIVGAAMFIGRVLKDSNKDKDKDKDKDNDHDKYREYKSLIIPIYKLLIDVVELSKLEIINLLIKNGFKVSNLTKADEEYVLNIFNNIDFYSSDGVTYIKEIKENNILPVNNVEEEKIIINRLLHEDKIRADIQAYEDKILEDIEQGHWGLWEIDNENFLTNNVKVKLTKSLVARDPNTDVINGIVGIDFGTKSTVVVYQGDRANIHPMRVGTGNLNNEIAAYHYENPTIMEINDLESFIDNYIYEDYKPNTKWKDLTISHTAENSLKGSESKYFNSYLSDLKQWAGDKNRKIKLVDKKGYLKELSPFLELEDEEFNPIEIYAYYLGLYINNLRNGIYLNYVLSFPVTYEVAVREKIVKSFEKGIKKSLPPQLTE